MDTVTEMLRTLLSERYTIQISDLYVEDDGKDLLCFKVDVWDDNKVVSTGDGYFLDDAIAGAYEGTPEREASGENQREDA